MDISNNQKILILSPHTDDAELGCGGIMSRFSVEVMVFSGCGKSLPNGNKNVLYKECRQSLDTYGVDPIIHDFPVREFGLFRQHICDLLYTKRNQYDIVFCPSTADVHQDHQVITDEAKRVFKCSIFGYELPWNTKEFRQDVFIQLTENHIQAKIKALEQYPSQQKRPYFDPEFIKALARLRGLQAGTTYAEAFEIIRWIV